VSCSELQCAHHLYGCQKRRMQIKRDLQKRPAKETYKRDLQRDLQKSPTKEPYKRALQKSPTKETSSHQKRPVSGGAKRSAQLSSEKMAGRIRASTNMSTETISTKKRPTKETCERWRERKCAIERPTKRACKRDLHKSPTKETYKETYKRDLQKNPTKEPYQRDLHKRPTKETSTHQKRPVSGGAKGSARLSPDRMAVRVRDSMALPLLPLAASICWQNRLRHKENVKRNILSAKRDVLSAKTDCECVLVYT